MGFGEDGHTRPFVLIHYTLKIWNRRPEKRGEPD